MKRLRILREELIAIGATLVVSLVYYIVAIYLSIGLDFALPLVLLLVTGPVASGVFFERVYQRPEEISPSRVARMSLVAPIVAVFGLVWFGFETIICAVMAAPIYIPLQILGVWIGLRLRRTKVEEGGTRLNVSILGFPLLILPIELATAPESSFLRVQTEILIHAPREVVWGNTLEIPKIDQGELPSTASHLILRSPQPIEARLEGNVRHLTWTKGVNFQEHITKTVPASELTWDFVFHDIESLRAIDTRVRPDGGLVHLTDGGYNLIELNEGQTLLKLETRYTLRTPMNGYLAWWGEFFVQDFHKSVLSVIKQRSEA